MAVVQRGQGSTWSRSDVVMRSQSDAATIARGQNPTKSLFQMTINNPHHLSTCHSRLWSRSSKATFPRNHNLTWSNSNPESSQSFVMTIQRRHNPTRVPKSSQSFVMTIQRRHNPIRVPESSQSFVMTLQRRHNPPCLQSDIATVQGGACPR